MFIMFTFKWRVFVSYTGWLHMKFQSYHQSNMFIQTLQLLLCQVFFCNVVYILHCSCNRRLYAAVDCCDCFLDFLGLGACSGLSSKFMIGWLLIFLEVIHFRCLGWFALNESVSSTGINAPGTLKMFRSGSSCTGSSSRFWPVGRPTVSVSLTVGLKSKPLELAKPVCFYWTFGHFFALLVGAFPKILVSCCRCFILPSDATGTGPCKHLINSGLSSFGCHFEV